MISTKFQTNFKRLMKIIPHLENYNAGQAIKASSSGFMDLHLDILSKTEDQMHIALAHYYKQHGDSIPDPDMQIRIFLKHGWAEALTYQDTYRFQEVYTDLETGSHYPKLRKELNQFLAQWLLNLRRQGFKITEPTLEATSGIIRKTSSK